MQIGKDTIASIDYTLTDNAGNEIDTSRGRGPLSYMHGKGQIIPGLENALEGKQKGDALKVSIPPEQAYGVRDENLVQGVPRQNFGGIQQIDVGMRFQARSPEGMRVVTVVAVDEKTVTVDANHPLAGQTLNFDVNVVDVREASQQERDHGHACHGGSCENCGGH